MDWIVLAIAAWAIIQYVLLLLLIRFNWKSHSENHFHSFPHVSILIAVRNEEEELPKLLESLNALDYPKELLEIWIADDESEDCTKELLEKWKRGEENRRILRIEGDLLKKYHINGKANALAILGKKAKGDYFFFTDGDCQVPSTWIKSGIQGMDPEIGILIGVTEVKASSLFQKLQALDWWLTLGIVKAVTDLKLPTTGLGNNMVISRKAYQACGGFENLPSSLTEDLEISKAIVNAGFSIAQEVSEQILIQTKAEYSWRKLLQQRKRWVSGVMTLSIGWKILLGFQAFFFPAIIWLLVDRIEIGISIWLSKIFLQGLFIEFFANRTRRKVGVIELFAFDFYQILSYSLTILYYFWPSSVQWKARKYP